MKRRRSKHSWDYLDELRKKLMNPQEFIQVPSRVPDDECSDSGCSRADYRLLPFLIIVEIQNQTYISHDKSKVLTDTF